MNKKRLRRKLSNLNLDEQLKFISHEASKRYVEHLNIGTMKRGTLDDSVHTYAAVQCAQFAKEIFKSIKYSEEKAKEISIQIAANIDEKVKEGFDEIKERDKENDKN